MNVPAFVLHAAAALAAAPVALADERAAVGGTLNTGLGVELSATPVSLPPLSVEPDLISLGMQPRGGGGGEGEAVAPAPDDAGELAKKLSNPVAAMISVPFQFNFDTGYGPKEADRWTLNVQPVIPFDLSSEWNLIVRTILPVIHQGSPADGVDSDFGMGDVTQSFFFSPVEKFDGWILAVGPAVLWPTGTTPGLRSEQLGLGPTALALRQEHGWTYGILANHIWGVTQSDDHDEVNATFLQPFISYQWPTATTLAFNTESTYDWTNEQWTVPLNLILSQIIKVGGKPVQLSLGGRYYAESPEDGPEWGVRFVVTLLFPK